MPPRTYATHCVNSIGDVGGCCGVEFQVTMLFHMGFHLILRRDDATPITTTNNKAQENK
ncbi:hypothetical protein [Allorhodopirellula heiligendammensis]|uniref:Uncharacterized protein n=1 Tax=Allorhodopirellula heiligendammensis TaxID=2714739 RepID=A0A5C6BJD2_9BACT|nr:hypothetical protein [Allorhodopirellula heiligendammensis]TWU10554.1 hypothetical protein Poly21_44590 [Allorhodopirellula heiligendammensis]